MKQLYLTLFGVAFVAVGLTVAADVTPTPVRVAQADPDPELFAALMTEGADIYRTVGCRLCHSANGEGGVGPALVGNEFLSRRTGVVGQIMDPDEEHGVMPAFDGLLDREIAAVATYIRNSWGNDFGIVPIATVGLFRAGMGGG